MPDPCGSLERDTGRALGALTGAVGAAAAVAGEVKQQLRDVTRCTRTPRGAWGVVIDSLRLDGNDVGGRWSLVHVDAAGVRSAVTPDTTITAGGGGVEPMARTSTAENLAWTVAARVVPSAPVLFDYDGDGEPEAVEIVRTITTTESGKSFVVLRGRVWSAAAGGAGGVALYQGAKEIAVEEVRDVDGDHRPDLITHGPYAALVSVQCGSEEPYPVYGPLLLAHSLGDGGFSLADAPATAFARRECAAAPATILVYERDRPEFVHFSAAARNVACARLWGTDRLSIAREVAARCRRLNECQTCDDQPLLTRWGSLPPPARLDFSANRGP